MNPIRVVNNQALGQAMTVPGMKIQAQPNAQVRRNFLGQMGPTIGSEELTFRAAEANLRGVKKAYPKLITLIGDDGAQQAFEEATKAVEQTQAEFVRQIPRK